MDVPNSNYSPYLLFTKEEWAELRYNTPLTLSHDEVEELKGLNYKLSMQ